MAIVGAYFHSVSIVLALGLFRDLLVTHYSL
jgi:hypothetical protein